MILITRINLSIISITNIVHSFRLKNKAMKLTLISTADTLTVMISSLLIPPKSSRYLFFLHLNICSFSKNFDMLKCFLDSLDFDFGVIGIFETRILNSSIPHNLNLLNYTPFFTKTEAAAGGTGLYIYLMI